MTTNLLEREETLYEEMLRLFLGSAKIAIDNLDFTHHDSNKYEFLHIKRVQHLKSLFEESGCHRYHSKNRVSATVSQRDLEIACQASDVEIDTLKSQSYPPPQLVPPKQFKCLNGRHRLTAAQQSEVGGDYIDWWIVDLYDESISDELRLYLQNDWFSNPYPNPGEWYRNMRFCARNGAKSAATIWFALLSQDTQKLANRIAGIKAVEESLDNLLEFTGMWGYFEPGAMKFLLDLKSHVVSGMFPSSALSSHWTGNR
jgi:Protein of unknown function (DUF3723)